MKGDSLEGSAYTPKYNPHILPLTLNNLMSTFYRVIRPTPSRLLPMYTRLPDPTVHGLQNHLNLLVQDAVHGLPCLPFPLLNQESKPKVSLALLNLQKEKGSFSNILYLQELPGTRTFQGIRKMLSSFCITLMLMIFREGS